MFFGFDPFAMIGMNQPRQPNQNQNRQNQIPEENIFGTFASSILIDRKAIQSIEDYMEN